MKAVLPRMALVMGLTFNVVLLIVHLFMLDLLVVREPDIIGLGGDADVAVAVRLVGAIYLLPFVISFGVWLAGRTKGLSMLARANLFSMTAFYVIVLALVVFCRVNGIWITVN